MRITNNMMMNNFMGNLNGNMAKVAKYQNQLSSGHRITSLSDDPVGLMTMLGAKAKLSKLDMHSKSISDAQSWLSQTESSLDELNDVLSQAYEIAVDASNGTMSETDRQSAAKVVEQLRQHVIQIGNASYGGRFVFGGYNTTTNPFVTDGSGVLQYDGVDLTTAPTAETDALKSQIIRYSTGVNITTDVSINGVQLMGVGANNLNDILSGFVAALDSNAAPSTISPYIEKLSGKQSDVLTLLADVGGRAKRLELMETANADNELNYTDVLSKAEDVDIAQATMDYKMAQAVYSSSLQVGAMVIQPTLLEFLR